MKQCTCYALRAIDCTCKPAEYGELYTSPTAKQEQGEPFGWYDMEHGEIRDVEWNRLKPTYEGVWRPLYTTPQPAQKPLTDEQILRLLSRIDECAVRLPRGLREFARAIESAHGIKENT